MKRPGDLERRAFCSAALVAALVVAAAALLALSAALLVLLALPAALLFLLPLAALLVLLALAVILVLILVRHDGSFHQLPGKSGMPFLGNERGSARAGS